MPKQNRSFQSSNQALMETHPQPPSSLDVVQQWFASIITRPIDEDSNMQPISPSGIPMEIEAAKYIAPSPNLRPHQCIELYNQQYWWRLLSALHEIFPLVTRLFGYNQFNLEIGMPYLSKYPPAHWSLNTIGDNLPKWINEEYHAKDKKLIYDSAMIDWAYNHSFIVKKMPPLDLSKIPDAGNPESLLNVALYLQPHIKLFAWNYDLFTFRTAFIKEEGDYWLDKDFPELPKGRPYFFVLFRSPKNNILWKEISEGEYDLLRLFEKGSTVESACQILEKKEKNIYEQASQHLLQWFQDWTIRGWFSLENFQSKRMT